MSRETGWYRVKAQPSPHAKWQIAECIDGEWWRLAGVEGMVLGTFIEDNYEIGKTPVNPVPANESIEDSIKRGILSFFWGEVSTVDDASEGLRVVVGDWFENEGSPVEDVASEIARRLETRVVKEGDS